MKLLNRVSIQLGISTLREIETYIPHKIHTHTQMSLETLFTVELSGETVQQSERIKNRMTCRGDAM